MVAPSRYRLIDFTIKHLVGGISEAQVSLDEDAERDIRLWNEFAHRLSGSQTAQAFAEDVHVRPLRLSEYHIALDVTLAQSKERVGELGLNVFASPIHTFYRRRFSASRTATSQIEVVCKAVLTGKADGDQNSSLPVSERKEHVHG